MSGLRLQSLKEAGAFLLTTALSCGPSQLFGSIKLIVDTCLILANKRINSEVNLTLNNIQNNWDKFKTSSKASLIAQKLGLENDKLTQQVATNYFNTKKRKTEVKIKNLSRSIRADAYALIPLVGAHISWRVATGYEGKHFTPIFSKGVEQLLEHSNKIASRPLFLGRGPKSKPSSHGIEVLTSTKIRRLEGHFRKCEKFDANGEPIDYPSTPETSKTATVVLFHPNMGGAEGMLESAEIYRKKGYNTVAVTLGGYRGDFQGSPGVTTSEKSMYQDIEAIKKFLSNWGVTEVAYHGFSLGCAAALQAATGESLVKNLKTLFVVLDQPFSSIAAVGDNVAGSLGKGVMSAGCPVGIDVELPGGLWTKTDGLNNLKKVSKLKEQNIPLICFEMENDFFMGRKKVNGKYTQNFAQDLLAARYGNASERIKNLVSLPGGHGANSLRNTSRWDTNLIPSH